MATQVKLTEPPGITSTPSGGTEKCGGTRRTKALIKKNTLNVDRGSIFRRLSSYVFRDGTVKQTTRKMKGKKSG
jgi:hypothetical protein